MTAELHAAKSPSSRLALSEDSVGDAIVSFYEFGQIRRQALGEAAEPGRGARLLFGPHSGAADAATDDRVISGSGLGGAPALHFTAEAEDPTSPIRVARSYLLSAGKLAQPWPVDDVEREDARPAVQWSGADAQALASLYQQLVAALSTGAEAYVAAARAGASAPKQLAAAAAEAAAAEVEQVARGQFRLECERVDAVGRLLPDQDCGRRCFLFVRASLASVPSAEAAGAPSLGRLVLGDTFVFQPAGDADFPPRAVNATAHIPYFHAWVGSGDEEIRASELTQQLADVHVLRNCIGLGDPVGRGMPVEPCAVLVGGAMLGCVRGALLLHERGFVLTGPSLSPLVVSFPLHVASLEVVYGPAYIGDGDPEAETGQRVAVLLVEFKSARDNPVMRCAPEGAGDFGRFVGLPLGPSAVARDALLAVLSGWHAACEELKIPFEGGAVDGGASSSGSADGQAAPSKLPAALVAGYEAVYPDFVALKMGELVMNVFAKGGGANGGGESGGESGGGGGGGAGGSANLSASFSASVSPAQARAAAASDDGRFPVTLLIGVPGSHVEEVADTVCDLSGEENRWVTARADSAGGFTAAVARAAAEHAASGATSKTKRIMVVVCGYVDPTMLVLAFAGPDVAGCKLGSTVAVVSVANLYTDARCTQFMPTLLEQVRCASAYRGRPACGSAPVESCRLLRVLCMRLHCGCTAVALRLHFSFADSLLC
jgi:hypothetical protein